MHILREQVALVATVVLCSAAALASGTAKVAVKQPRLQPLCVDGKTDGAHRRSWDFQPGEHVVAFTMDNAPRSGAATSADPGIAVIKFSVEGGHRYDVEIRAAGETYSNRVWAKGEWRPIVRDRTNAAADRIVSGDPEWVDQACAGK
jgi:hypothetical protein